jgi:hypothetical protein
MERAMHGTFDHWRTTNPDDKFLGPDPEAEEELPEPEITEEWNASRGEHETVVTFASGSKFSVRQNSDDNWEVHGSRAGWSGRMYVDFTTREHALSWLTDIEHWGW